MHEGSFTGPRLPPLGSRGENRHKIPFRPILVDSAVPTWSKRLDRHKDGENGRI